MSDFWSNISPQLAKSIGVVATTLLAWWVIVRIGRRAAARVDPLEPERQQRVATLWQAGRRVITILLGVIVLLMLMSIWDVPITPLLAVGSAVGLAVGFGAQDSVKDLIAGFLILAEGLLMYLPQAEVEGLFNKLARSFSKSEFVFEVVMAH